MYVLGYWPKWGERGKSFFVHHKRDLSRRSSRVINSAAFFFRFLGRTKRISSGLKKLAGTEYIKQIFRFMTPESKSSFKQLLFH